MKRLLSVALTSTLLLAALAGCGSAAPASSAGDSGGSGFDPSTPITVISREPGSGTRGAFVELFGIEEKGADGSKVDRTTLEAVIANQTNVVMTSVAGDPYAIGYSSLGSLNDSVKALRVDGAEATAENVASGAYKAARPFNIATKGEPEGLAGDFIGFILSADGQAVVGDSGYIAVAADAAPYAGDRPEGKLVIAGSSSVAPVMEKLIEAYREINPKAVIELQSSDSTAGMTGAMDGTFDIGMASRELKDSETAELTGTAIALDGIAVIVNPENTLDGVTADQIKGIYTGAITDWADVAA